MNEWLFEWVGQTTDYRYYFRIPAEIFPGKQTIYGRSPAEVVEKILGLAASDLSGKWDAWLDSNRPRLRPEPQTEPREFYVYNSESQKCLTDAMTEGEATEAARQRRSGLRPGDVAAICLVRISDGRAEIVG